MGLQKRGINSQPNILNFYGHSFDSKYGLEPDILHDLIDCHRKKRDNKTWPGHIHLFVHDRIHFDISDFFFLCDAAFFSISFDFFF